MKFSIVTAAFNMERWIEETLESVATQEGDFEIEYIIINDKSSDRTKEIVENFKKKIETQITSHNKGIDVIFVENEKNIGLYATINRGFNMATGDVFAWINADDIYEPDAFAMIQKSIETFPEISWLKGITSTISEDSKRLKEGEAKIYHQNWLRLGVYGQESYFVEQDSVFWKASLWRKIGGMPETMRSAADYWLWIQFAKYEPMWTLDFKVSCFRKRDGQISKSIDKYKKEQKESRQEVSLKTFVPRIFFSIQSRIENIFPRSQKLFLWLYRIIYLPFLSHEFLDIEDGKIIKKKAWSYKVKKYEFTLKI